ncbi:MULTISPECIES: ABC transporter permease subunit [unclassified Clostridium]|uniref:carbohydrate ABC transporter permease n=1 Tax=unclassified Clostridium TaxID=2614128 RepID=UPI001C8B4BFC|nr:MULTISPECIES: ABC transporter permease subunit [unclassified Clostridium]MBX9139211.1 ABC transporter permease subunit [Clostridium sp. K12(2020)]MBX9145980.1 ABC transporter permease subunit [Clostridium sp. K13]
MKKFNKYLYDNINREYDRRNLYLYEVSALQEEIEAATGKEKQELKNKLNELVKNKKDHAYNKQLAEYKEKEKQFLREIKNKVSEYRSKVDTTLPKNVQNLQLRLFKAKELVKFYQNYIKLTYDAELVYEQSKLEIAQIPPVIEFAKECAKELKEAQNKLSKIDNVNNEKFNAEFKAFKEEENKKLQERIKEIKTKCKEGLISGQAKDNTIKELKRKYKEVLLVKSFECEKTYNEEIVKNKKYELSKTVKQKINTVNINVADLRRVYPIETEKTMPWVSWVTFLIPGLAQVINKQYIKAIIMFFATIYIYLMAIPYSLGYGNYKGDGIAGLITLAADGGRLDRSIIFMIEGILAIFLLLIGIFLMLICFKDANKVEKDTIKGSRYKSWVETKQTVFEDGFPYLVLSPAAIITIFIVCIPVVTTVLLAFTGMGPDTQAKFGWEALKNYKMIFLGEGMIGAIFWRILGWTIVWTIGATTLAIALGFILAIVLNNDRIKGKVLFRSIYLLPWAVPAFISILFFSILAADGGTVVNYLKEVFGPNFSIKNDPFIIRLTLICIQAWLGSAYIFLLSTGVLQSINAELYEAADIDGATSFKKLSKITVPLVLFQTAPLLVGQYTFNFNNFSIIALFNNGGPFDPSKYGNLAGSSDLLISYIFKLTMNSQYQAIGATITVIISVALMIIAYIGYKNTDAFKRG